MIAYRYCSDEELNSLNRKDVIKGFEYSNDPMRGTNQYEENVEYLHFFADSDNVYCLDPVDPENFVEFLFPQEFSDYWGVGNYYDYEDKVVKMRRANQFAIPASLVRREHVKNIKSITNEEFKDNIKRLRRNAF